MPTLTIIAFVLLIIYFLVDSLILLGTTKIFKIPAVTFKKSLLILFYSFLAQIVTVIIFALFLPALLASILGMIVNVALFCIIFRKYYPTTWGKTIGVYVVNYIFSIVFAIVMALFLAIPIRLFVIEPFVVSGTSMSPHYNTGDYLFMGKFDRSFKRDDVIIYKYSSNNTYLIKRIIGIPSDHITLNNRVLTINESLYNDANLVGQFGTSTVDVTLAQDEYFVLGDNLEHSAIDSITTGPIQASQIVGKIVVNLGKIGK